MDLSEDERTMLTQGIERADRLLAGLLEQQAEIERKPPKLSPADEALGRMALQNAIASARRMVMALREAQQIADEPDRPDQDCEQPT